MIKVLESRYIPSRKHFSNTVIPELYEQTRRGIVEELSNIAYVALTSLHHFGVGDKNLSFADTPPLFEPHR